MFRTKLFMAGRHCIKSRRATQRPKIGTPASSFDGHPAAERSRAERILPCRWRGGWGDERQRFFGSIRVGTNTGYYPEDTSQLSTLVPGGRFFGGCFFFVGCLGFFFFVPAMRSP
ncbi:MAG: hypothetical protein JWO52_1787 [Gammaproteobacteria bacterium]|nr:hypothetical protein [Gammaproteobacteria bacterium]